MYIYIYIFNFTSNLYNSFFYIKMQDEESMEANGNTHLLSNFGFCPSYLGLIFK